MLRYKSVIRPSSHIRNNPVFGFNTLIPKKIEVANSVS